MRLALNNDAAGHPKTGPRRTLRAAKELKDLVPQRRYPVLGWPRCCLRNEFIQCSMTNLLNLTHTTKFIFKNADAVERAPTVRPGSCPVRVAPFQGCFTRQPVNVARLQ